MAFAPRKIWAAGECIRRKILSPADAIRELLFEKQRQLFDSVLTRHLSAALAGRRSGKTGTLIALICLVCGFLGWNVLLVYPNAKQARNRALGKIRKLAKGLGLHVHERASDGIMEIGAGSLEIGSAHNRAAIDSIRGDGVHLAIIDEPGSIEEDLIVYLMEDTVSAMLLDEEGRWLLTGTPGQVPIGKWYDISQGEANENADATWNVIDEWTYRDNPFLKNPERTIDAELAAAGKTRASDLFLREYLAQWVSNDTIRPLHWTPANDFSELPAEAPVMRILGVDIGWSDADAIMALYVYRGRLYDVEEDEASKQTDPQLASKVRGFQVRHQPHIIVGDSAQAKSIANLQAEGIPIVGAKKGRGSVGMGLGNMDSLLREVRFFAKEGSGFARDAAVVRWKPGFVGKQLAKKPHSNIIPAGMYALDEVPPPLLLPPPPPLPPTVFDDPVLKALLANPNEDRPNYGG